jgi:hypothetical protein
MILLPSTMLGPATLLAFALSARGRPTGKPETHLESTLHVRGDTSLVGTWHLRMDLTKGAKNDGWLPNESVDGTVSLRRAVWDNRGSSGIEGVAHVDLRGRLAVAPPSGVVTIELQGDHLQFDLGRCVRSDRGESCYADGGTLSFTGRRQSHDSITGVWEQEFYCCGARGTFVMTRTR